MSIKSDKTFEEVVERIVALKPLDVSNDDPPAQPPSTEIATAPSAALTPTPSEDESQ